MGFVLCLPALGSRGRGLGFFLDAVLHQIAGTGSIEGTLLSWGMTAHDSARLAVECSPKNVSGYESGDRRTP
jgi:hypothetical protein